MLRATAVEVRDLGFMTFAASAATDRCLRTRANDVEPSTIRTVGRSIMALPLHQSWHFLCICMLRTSASAHDMQTSAARFCCVPLSRTTCVSGCSHAACPVTSCSDFKARGSNRHPAARAHCGIRARPRGLASGESLKAGLSHCLCRLGVHCSSSQRLNAEARLAVGRFDRTPPLLRGCHLAP